MARRKKPNLVDVVIVILFIFAVPVVLKYIAGLPGSSLSQKGIPVMLRVSFASGDISESLAGGIRRGDTVADADSGGFVGYVEVLEKSAYLASSEYFSDERIVPERVVLEMELRCEAVKYGDYYVIGDKKVIIGETYRLCVPGLYFDAECISVSEDVQPVGIREILPKFATE